MLRTAAGVPRQGGLSKAISLYKAVEMRIAKRNWGNCIHNLETNKAASPNKAVILDLARHRLTDRIPTVPLLKYTGLGPNIVDIDIRLY